MKQEIKEHHRTDANGTPTGGISVGIGISVQWQNGALGRGDERKAPNGAFVEDVIQVALGRIEFYQSSKFACPENAEAAEHLKLALAALGRRTAEREARAVEGTHTV